MAKWTKNHMMEIGLAVGLMGLALTVVAWTYSFTHPTPGFLSWYQGIVDRPEGDYNLILFIAGPLVLIMGGFYFGEQVVLRRRFERLLDTEKRSEFTSRRRELEDLARKLPEGFHQRIASKESEFKTRRA